MKNPCLNCEERKLKCHATCEKYKEFTDEGDASKKLDMTMLCITELVISINKQLLTD